MQEEIFHQLLAQWRQMPGDLEEREYFMSVYPAPLDAKFHVLSALYLESSSQQQQLLIDCFIHSTAPTPSPGSGNAHCDNAIIYMRRIARSVRSAADGDLLRLGVAAAAWTEGRADSHDLLVSLAFLYHAAARAGIDPLPCFEDIATLAGEQTQEALRAFLHCEASTVRRMVQHYEGTC